ncbi:MAG: hypothetical protein RLP44_05655 [Aggregatilineales bacterium]
MSKNILIGIALVLTLSCALTVALVQQLTDSDRVETIAHRIADFDLPAGYQTDYAVDVLDYTIAAYKSDDEQTHLVFVQGPSGIIPNESVIAGYIPNTSRHADWHATTVLSTEQRTIRDQPATLTISERTNGEGQRYRSANLVFSGREGTALLVFNQPVTQWDDESVDTFIQSIH